MTNAYEVVTAKMINALKGGEIPWQKPWNGENRWAVSYTTGRAYSFLNQLLLGGMGGEWLTFNQIKKLGGCVKGGEKSQQVVFWTQISKKETDASGNEIEKSFPILKTYSVFEIGQTTGIDRKHTKPIETFENSPIEKAEEVVGLYFDRETLNLFKDENGDRAFYRPSLDEIHIPEMKQFKNVEEYYSTLFHEMTHSTGHQNRLNRKEVVECNMFGSSDYSKEELVAEMGAAFLCNILGIDTTRAFNNSVAYIQSWLTALQNDTKMLVSAAGRAEKAVKYILGEKA